MGSDKAMVRLAGRPILDWIVGRLRPQAEALAINANDERFAGIGLPIIKDLPSSTTTPLAGLHASLRWASEAGFDALLTAPSDSPFLPLDLATRLADQSPAIAVSGGQRHFLTGLWPIGLLADFEATRYHRARDWVAHCGATAIAWDDSPFDPFLNINTPGDLAQAERIAALFSP